MYLHSGSYAAYERYRPTPQYRQVADEMRKQADSLAWSVYDGVDEAATYFTVNGVRYRMSLQQLPTTSPSQEKPSVT